MSLTSCETSRESIEAFAAACCAVRTLSAGAARGSAAGGRRAVERYSLGSAALKMVEPMGGDRSRARQVAGSVVRLGEGKFAGGRCSMALLTQELADFAA